MQFSVLSLVFILVALIVFYAVRIEARPYVLAAFSFAYPFLLNKYAGIAVILTCLIVYLGGILIESVKSYRLMKQGMLYLFILFTAGSLAILKCFEWMKDRGNADSMIARIAIPIGFSFYIFQSIAYLSEVFSDRIQAVRNPVIFCLYLSWFPKFICGPIEEPDLFFQQINKLSEVKLFEKDRLLRFVGYATLGCFYKVVVADNLAPIVDKCVQDPEHYSGYILLIVAILYSLQIYCDFAGYSMLVIGISQLFGIELIENFKTPYFAANIGEFWDRWHISLSKWLTKYVYIPLGGNRKGLVRRYLNILIVFLVSGIWHGVGMNFIVWGMLHAIYSIVDRILEKKGCNWVRQGHLGRIITFFEVTIAWIFFRLSSASGAIRYIKLIFTNFSKDSMVGQLNALGMTHILLIVVILLIWIYLEQMLYRRGVEDYLSRRPFYKWMLLIWFLLVFIMIFGAYGPDNVGKMIYMNF